MVPLHECKDRWLYRLDARNIRLGVFSKFSSEFVGLRVKFDQVHLDAEYHWDYGGEFASCKPLEALEELPANVKATEFLWPDEPWEGKAPANDALFAWMREMEAKYP
jgi:hypothetical protein